MSEVNIKRRVRSVSILLSTSVDASATLRADDMAGGVISLGTMSTNATTLQVFGSVDESGPYSRIYGADGAAADITLAPSTAAGRVYSLPDPIFAVPYIRIVSGGTYSTGVTGIVSFKS
jgi:hypothetical protein